MKKRFTKLVVSAALLLSSGSFFSSYADEINSKTIACNLNLPKKFVMRQLYKDNSALIFRSENFLFAIGKFNKKFSLKTPCGDIISTARLYELLPEKDPLLVIRDDFGHVLGFVHLQNYNNTQIFTPVGTTIYDASGKEVLNSKYPLSSSYCKIFSSSNGQLVAKTEEGIEKDIVVNLEDNYEELEIDQGLLITVLQIHASKSLLVGLTNYIAIDEIHIDELGSYSQHTDGEKHIKGLSFKESNMSKESNPLHFLKEQLEAEAYPVPLNDQDREEIAISLNRRFGTEKNSFESISKNLPSLTNEDKLVLIDMLNCRL